MGGVGKQPHSTDQHMQLGMWQLWRSLPRPCKLFLVVCVVQAFVSGAFAAQELAQVGQYQTLHLLYLIHFLPFP